MPLDDLHQSKRGLASVVACLVHTINETNPTFQGRFLARLEAAYYELRDNPTASSKNDHMAPQPVSWVQELLTGWNITDVDGKPFLPDYQPTG